MEEKKEVMIVRKEEIEVAKKKAYEIFEPILVILPDDSVDDCEYIACLSSSVSARGMIYIDPWEDVFHIFHISLQKCQLRRGL